MNKLKTPLGEISICIDDKEIEYDVVYGDTNDRLCPNVLGRLQIKVEFEPDGKKHTISCLLSGKIISSNYGESGERLECGSFYSKDRYKLSIGLYGEPAYMEEKYIPYIYDYDCEYLENGMSYVILPFTKTKEYIFGVGWIDDVGEHDEVNQIHDRDVETWFAADPSYFKLIDSIKNNK